ncbi:MAG: sigma factor, partial [Staphylococcus epidermidis]|nr:sigma factor [Staphylococcus epidermidis]
MNLNKQQHEYTAMCLSQIENKSSEELFESLIEELKPLIYNKIRYISHNKYDIEDIYQEIAIKFYRALQKFDYQQGVPIEHYIYFLIRSVKYDYLRKV